MTLRAIAAALGIAVAASVAASPANAAESHYTSLDLGECTQQPIDPNDMLESGNWVCQGYLGIPVLVSESDLRFFVTYGADGANQPAAHQTIPPFNLINDTLEWRVTDSGTPYATILRFIGEIDLAENVEVLVVTRIADSGGICHVAYVNASANANANELARQAADLIAPNFECDYHAALWIGDRGTF